VLDQERKAHGLGGEGRAACVGGARAGGGAREDERKEHETSFTHSWSAERLSFWRLISGGTHDRFCVFSATVPAGSWR
jgi:hypothetical protein